MYKLDHTSGKPIYEQIRDNLKKLIIDGVLKPDEKILSVRELAVEMTINPNTIQKAYKDLENEGYIYSVRAKGYFVAPKDNVKNTDVLFRALRETVRELYYLGVQERELLETVFDIYRNNDGKENYND
ncbi:MAG: GntR family transcriptional regulator [Clostridia bacterium]|nr:GntR family transcriptional regulator [Clostridia bacterium]